MFNLAIALAIIALFLFAFIFGETLFTLTFYIIYRYDGGTRSLSWYKQFIKNCIIDF